MTQQWAGFALKCLGGGIVGGVVIWFCIWGFKSSRFSRLVAVDGRVLMRPDGQRFRAELKRQYKVFGLFRVWGFWFDVGESNNRDDCVLQAARLLNDSRAHIQELGPWVPLSLRGEMARIQIGWEQARRLEETRARTVVRADVTDAERYAYSQRILTEALEERQCQTAVHPSSESPDRNIVV